MTPTGRPRPYACRPRSFACRPREARKFFVKIMHFLGFWEKKIKKKKKIKSPPLQLFFFPVTVTFFFFWPYLELQLHLEEHAPGLAIVDVSADGNCGYHAISDQLSRLGIERDHITSVHTKHTTPVNSKTKISNCIIRRIYVLKFLSNVTQYWIKARPRHVAIFY